MKIRNIFLYTTLLLFLGTVLYSQSNNRGAVITGKVFEVGTSTPMEFANIVIYKLPDSSQVTGTVTNSQGIFELTGIKEGNYYAEVSFIGFTSEIIDNINITKPGRLDLGEIELTPHTYGTEDVIVEGERSPISYEIDKKVINVSQQLTSVSGTAVDILENVPSVTVDIEGNVELRGSGSFTVLIDGRPTVLDANEALQQIPASSIENIEIITNPSAKYDPEGTAGIINIVMKKSKNKGISGVFEVNGGTQQNYGGEALLDYKDGPLQANVAVDLRDRNFNGSDNEYNWTENDGIRSFIQSSGSSVRGGDAFGIRGSASLDLSSNSFITLGARYGDRSWGRTSTENYREWNSQQTQPQFFNNRTERERSGQHINFFSTYTHEFNNNGHKFIAEIDYGWDESDEITVNRLVQGDNIIEGQRTTESGPEDEFEAKVDYTLPLSEASKFEAGYAGEIEISEESSGLFLYDSDVGDYVEQTRFTNTTNYDTREHALYTMYSNEIGNLGFQFGFRTEYTGQSVELQSDSNKYSIKRWDYFPGAHFSYNLFDDHQIMTSYTRRINRPRGWQLEPFETWMDAYNVRTGNPALSPEYIDSYELGYQTLIGDVVFSLEGYYRFTDNKIERIRSVYGENVTLHTIENVGSDYSLGTELFFNFDPIEIWNVNLMGNLYDYRVEGELNGQSFERNSFNWNVRFNNRVKLLETTQLQFNVFYNSPTVSSQGRREDFFFASLALRHEMFDKMLAATLQVRDVFGTAEFERVYQSGDFYNYGFYTRESPMVMLNLRFNINNYKSDRDEPQNGNGGGMGEGDEF